MDIDTIRSMASSARQAMQPYDPGEPVDPAALKRCVMAAFQEASFSTLLGPYLLYDLLHDVPFFVAKILWVNGIRDREKYALTAVHYRLGHLDWDDGVERTPLGPKHHGRAKCVASMFMRCHVLFNAEHLQLESPKRGRRGGNAATLLRLLEQTAAGEFVSYETGGFHSAFMGCCVDKDTFRFVDGNGREVTRSRESLLQDAIPKAIQWFFNLVQHSPNYKDYT